MNQEKFKKIVLLNQIIFDSMMEKDKKTIMKNFTKAGMKILDADFATAWWRSNKDKSYQLVYKSPNFPYNPPLPRKRAGNYIARKTKKPFFDSDVKSEKYDFKIGKYLKSYIIIPIFHKSYVYGSLVFCYKNRHIFTKDEVTLSNLIGNTAAQAITVHRLLKTDILLSEERRRTEFIANATHELRTPLAIMRGYIDLALMNNEDSKSKTAALKLVNREISLLTLMLKDLELLTTFGASAKKIANFKQVDLHKVLKIIAVRLKPLAIKKNIAIKLEKEDERDWNITGDKIYLEKLFLNLIKNAITYGKNNGKIIINILRNKDTMIIKVRDNGIGISKEDLPKIFRRFYRADKAHSDLRSGLGLAIAKWAAEMHNGKISAKSTLGKGSTFTVSLPIKIK